MRLLVFLALACFAPFYECILESQLNSVKCCFKQSTLSRCDGDNHKKIYFYSHVSGKCLEVKPGRCAKNSADKKSNVFSSLEICQNRCEIPIGNISKSCIRKLVTKPHKVCKGSHTKFYFDKKENKCLEFKYPGCGDKGKDNNFPTKEDCERFCHE